MACGCGKSKAATVNVPGKAAVSATPQSSQVLYDVLNGQGGLVASSSSVVFARSEARKVGGTVVPRQVAP